MTTATAVLGGVPAAAPPGPAGLLSDGGDHAAAMIMAMRQSMLVVMPGAHHIEIRNLAFRHHTWLQLLPSGGIGFVDTTASLAGSASGARIRGGVVLMI